MNKLKVRYLKIDYKKLSDEMYNHGIEIEDIRGIFIRMGFYVPNFLHSGHTETEDFE